MKANIKATPTTGAALLAGLITAACSADGGQEPDARVPDFRPELRTDLETAEGRQLRADVDRALQARGYSSEGLQLYADHVRVEGDLLLPLDTVLSWESEVVDKGYLLKDRDELIQSVSDVCVEVVPDWYSPSGQEVPQQWAEAVWWAMQHWSQATAVNMRWEPFFTPCPAVVFVLYDDIYDDDGSLALSTLAMAPPLPRYESPPFGRATAIWVNRAYNGPKCDGGNATGDENAFAEKIAVAAHEFGHVFGLRHPQEGANLLVAWNFHIPNTAYVDPNNLYNYKSVMHTDVCPGTFNKTRQLSADDKKSIEWIYGPPN